MFTTNKTNCSQLHSIRPWHLSSLSLQRSLIRMPVQFVIGQRCNIITHTTPFTTAHTKCTLSRICSRRRCLCFQYIETAKHLDAVQTEHKKMFQCIWRLFDCSQNRKETKIMPTIDMYATGRFESHQVYLCVEMAKMVDAAGSNPVGFNPSEFESRFPHLRRITRKAQRRYLGYRDDKFVGSNPTSGTMQQWLNRYSNGLLLRHPLMRSAGSIPVYYALSVHSLKVKHQSPKL